MPSTPGSAGTCSSASMAQPEWVKTTPLQLHKETSNVAIKVVNKASSSCPPVLPPPLPAKAATAAMAKALKGEKVSNVSVLLIIEANTGSSSSSKPYKTPIIIVGDNAGEEQRAQLVMWNASTAQQAYAGMLEPQDTTPRAFLATNAALKMYQGKRMQEQPHAPCSAHLGLSSVCHTLLSICLLSLLLTLLPPSPSPLLVSHSLLFCHTLRTSS